jgi:hypothetical protein
MNHQQKTAIHEAGHAVMACVLDRPFEQVSLADAQDREWGSGHLALPARAAGLQDPLYRQQIESAILVGLAGAAAEALCADDDCGMIHSFVDDYPALAPGIALLEALDGQDHSPSADRASGEALTLSLWARALDLLGWNWEAVLLLADVLNDGQEVVWPLVRDIVEHIAEWD